MKFAIYAYSTLYLKFRLTLLMGLKFGNLSLRPKYTIEIMQVARLKPYLRHAREQDARTSSNSIEVHSGPGSRRNLVLWSFTALPFSLLSSKNYC